MSAVLPADRLNVHESQVDLVNQCGRLQKMARLFPRHAAMGHTAQLIFDHGSQLFQGRIVSLAPCFEELRNPSLREWFTKTRQRLPRALAQSKRITTKLDRLKDYFVQHDPSCTDFALHQVRGVWDINKETEGKTP